MKNIYSLFNNTAKKYANKIAITYNNESLSFSHLQNCILYYANQLRQNGINKGDIVAIYLSNTPEAVATTLSAISIGAIALPINNQLPQNLVIDILKSSGASIILCNRTTKLSNLPCKLLIVQKIGSILEQSIIMQDEFNINESEFAFCIYTSGSTGKQKGLLLTHKGILNHIKAKWEILNLNDSSVICQSFNNGFVASIWQILAPLIYGATLVVCSDEEIKNPLALLKCAVDSKADTIALLPQFLISYCILIENGHKKLDLSNLKNIVLTGEQVTLSVIQTFYKHYNIPLINAYGQSECCDDTMHYKIPYDFNESIVPIGSPIQNVNAFLIDEQGNIIKSANQIGELCLYGICIARPVIENQCFISSFFNIDSINGPIFKSGDLVYRDKKGIYYYCGRKDNMIKIRGYKVFLEEIERTIELFDTIEKAMVVPIVDQGTVKGFEADIICKGNIDKEKLLFFLKQRLPAYSIPMIYKKVSTLKKLPNGKLLRRSENAKSTRKC